MALNTLWQSRYDDEQACKWRLKTSLKEDWKLTQIKSEKVKTGQLSTIFLRKILK